MKTLVDQLSQYADYHRDPRNIHTHLMGVPLILLAVTILLSRPFWTLGDGLLVINPAVLLALLVTVYYVLLDMRYGIALAVVLAAMLALSGWIAHYDTAVWISCGLGLFVAGWIIQFVGHYWEGRKPAFMDDIVGLLIGPLFVLAEIGFALGLRKEVQQAIEARSGPVRHTLPVAL